MRGTERKQFLILLLATTLLLSIFFSNLPYVHGKPSADMEVKIVVWGESSAYPIPVSPGAQNVPLTIEVINLSPYALSGIYATLKLSYPFEDYYTGGDEAVARGISLDSFSQFGEVKPSGSFALTFRMNIDKDAKPGVYNYTMELEYYVVYVGPQYVEGKPKSMKISIHLHNRPPNIDSFRPSNITPAVLVGDSLNFTSVCSDPDGDPLTYEWKLDNVEVSNMSYYVYVPTEEDVGVHTIILTISDGELTAFQSWTVTVNILPQLYLSIDDNHVFGGKDNSLFLTIQSEVWSGTVQVGINLPPPLAVYSNRSWTFKSVEPKSAVSIPLELYVPANLIGGTVSGTLTVSYQDKYGSSHADTLVLDLIVIAPEEPTLAMWVSNSHIKGGRDNVLEISLRNEVWSGTVQVKVALPAPLVVYGNQSWTFRNVQPGEEVNFSIRLYAPLSVIGSTIPGTLIVSYKDEKKVSYTNTLNLNLDVTASSEDWLTVYLSDNHIIGGYDNLIDIKLKNSVWSGTVKVSISLLAPVAIYGNQTWVIESVKPEDEILIPLQLYAPETMIGSTISGSLTVNYEDGNGTAYVDTYPFSLVVDGRVDLVAYDLSLSPSTVSPGDTVTFTATLLNRGNVPALFTNVSIQGSTVLDLTSESSSYIGEVDVNSPVPFTLIANVKSGVANGSYPLTVTVTYQDSRYRSHTMTLNVEFNVQKIVHGEPPPSIESEAVRFLYEGGWVIIVASVSAIAILVFYMRRLGKSKKSGGA